MKTLHVVQAGVVNGDLDWLKQARRNSVSETWVVPKRARPGDSVLIYVPGFGLIAKAKVASEPLLRRDWHNRYGAALTGFHLLNPAVTLDILRERVPDFAWLRYPRSITTPSPSVAGELWRLVHESRRRTPYRVSDIQREIAIAEPELVRAGVTMREVLIAARLGQGLFRQKVLRYWRACALTGCKMLAALRASHIKPWRDSTNKERLDGYNGLLLVGTVDLLFDAGLISFTSAGALLISGKLPKAEWSVLGLRPSLKLARLHAKHLAYLKWHRERVFAGAA